MIETRPTLLVAAAKWWPLSARLAVSLRRHGCDVVALCPANHPLSHVSGLRALHRYEGTDSIGSLHRALRESRPDRVVPCDDGVVAQLHVIHAQDPDMRALIERSLGPPQTYDIVRSRQRLLALADELGVRVPRTRAVEAESDLTAWHAGHPGRAVVKVDGENGGNGVEICATLEQATAAYRRFRAPLGLATAVKRWVIDCDPLALWRRHRPGGAGVSIQEFIPGRPANCMFACREGELLGVVSVAVVVSQGVTGASTVVRLIRDPAMEEAARRIAAHLSLSGFYGLDFIIDGAGHAHLIEMNPRCTQLGHLELPRVGSLAGAYAAAVRGTPPAAPRNPVRGELIAVFPQAHFAGAACRAYIDASHHDLPDEEPRLMEDLLRGPWSTRRWLSRLYHMLHPKETPAATTYEPPRTAERGAGLEPGCAPAEEAALEG